MICETAFAKVNMFLEVIGRMPHGYHHLQSVMVFADVGEWIRVDSAAEPQFTISGPEAAGLPADSKNNLILKAEAAYCKEMQISARHAIHLHKTMPVSSGIGGGSADAAAALRALNRLYDQCCGEAQLLDLAAQLGADVPACLLSLPLQLDGPGREITPTSVLGCQHGLLVNPRKGVSTSQVFQMLSAGSVPASVGPLENAWSLKSISEKTNHLHAPAQALCSDIRHVLAVLRGLAGVTLARMSGSGATCFALFETSQQSDTALRHLRKTQPHWWSKRAEFASVERQSQ